MNHHRFADLIDTAQLQELMSRLYAAAGIPVGIIDVDGTIHVATGWQDICTKFHRVHPATAQRCRESDAYIASHLEDLPYAQYRCKNGLWDIAVPVSIEGQHLATLFIGQFHFEGEVPERAEFVARAAACGFAVEEYLAALDRLPTFSRTKIDAILDYFLALVNQLVDEGLNRKKRLQVEEELARQRSLLNGVIEGTTDVVFVKDTEGRYLMVNTQTARVVGKTADAIVGQDDTFLFPAQEAAAVMALDREVMALAAPVTREEQLSTVQGSRAYLSTKGPITDEAGAVVGMFGISRDVTEWKELEEKLRQSLKMESIGRLAGGVAHDFNNKLTVILGYTELMKRHLPQQETLWRYLDEIEKAAEYSQELTTQLLAFSRQQVIAPRALDLNEVVQESARTLSRLIGEDIPLDLQLWGSPLGVRLDPSQLDQIIMNLAVNARDAMPEGGRITVATALEFLSQERCLPLGNVLPGPYARLSFADTGTGMDATTLQNIFEPYFTTKALGKGTGLGLATIYGIVTQNSGFIEVESEPGKGSAFHIYLPHLAEEAPAERPERPAAVCGSGNVLLVEDDNEVREMTTAMLTMLGYAVHAVSSPTEAIELCSDAQVQMDLVVSDVIMPGMSGKEMGDHIRTLRPGIEILYMSGYAPEMVSSRGVQEDGADFIMKPFQMRQLSEKIAQCLGRRGIGSRPAPPLPSR